MITDVTGLVLFAAIIFLMKFADAADPAMPRARRLRLAGATAFGAIAGLVIARAFAGWYATAVGLLGTGTWIAVWAVRRRRARLRAAPQQGPRGTPQE